MERKKTQIASNIAARQLQVAEQLAREQESYARAVAGRQADKAVRVRPLRVGTTCDVVDTRSGARSASETFGAPFSPMLRCARPTCTVPVSWSLPNPGHA